MKALLLLLLLPVLTHAQTTVIYSRLDAIEAQRVYRLARVFGPALIDTDLQPGLPWRDALTLGICSSRAVLLVWSKRAAASAEVAREVQTARLCGVPVVPVLIDGTPLPSNIDKQGVDWR